MSSNPSIASIQNFRRETLRLLMNIEQNIRELAVYSRTYHPTPSRALVEEINRLKLRRTSLIRLLEELEGANPFYWERRKEEAHRLFRLGCRELQAASEVVRRDS